MVLFINLSKDNREKFFIQLRKSAMVSWDKFYPRYKLSRTMFFNYLSGRYDLPKDLFDKWVKLTNMEGIEFRQVEKSRFLPKDLPKIIVDEKLAEIFGALNGDGHISRFQHEVNVVCDAKEKDYLIYLKRIFEEKFKIPFTFFEEPTKIKLRVYSKKLSDYLVNQHGLPKGKKKGKLTIPKIIYSSDKFRIGYVRGLFDTDGTIYLRRGRGLVIEISNADRKFLEEVAKILKNFEFPVSINNKHLSIYNQEHIHRFFKLIKPSNSKHLKKYLMYSR